MRGSNRHKGVGVTEEVIMTASRLVRSIAMGLMASGALLFPLFAQQPQKYVQIADDFSRGSSGWLATFSDYSLNEVVPRRIAEIRALPPEVDSTRQGYYLQAVNGADDLFTYLKKPLTLEDGIEPNATYQVEFLVEFASNASTECFGAGGAPGLAVELKVGANPVEPVSTLNAEKLILNLDKGNQSSDGADATLAGNIGVETDSCDSDTAKFVRAERRAAHVHRVRASEFGLLWLFVGTDSGYEGLNQLYYSRIVATLTRVEGGAQ